MMEITKTYMPSKLALIGQENMQTWRTEPLTVNAYNYFSDNAISNFFLSGFQQRSII